MVDPEQLCTSDPIEGSSAEQKTLCPVYTTAFGRSSSGNPSPAFQRSQIWCPSSAGFMGNDDPDTERCDFTRGSVPAIAWQPGPRVP